jgi:hypothetical protein
MMDILSDSGWSLKRLRKQRNQNDDWDGNAEKKQKQ